MDHTLSFLPAPTAPPTNVDILSINSSEITVQWGEIDCIDHNGDITGYSVLYEKHRNEHTKTLNISGGETMEVIISGLDSATNYSIEVAAVNSAGIGMYSATIYALTIGIILT